MTKAGDKIIEGAKEALAVAKGEIPAAAMWINGHRYVPADEADAEAIASMREIANLRSDMDKVKTIARREAFEEAARLIDEGFDRGIKSKNDKCKHGFYGWENCDSCCADAIRALARKEPNPPAEWHPIATAPMDGTEILGFGSASWRGKKYSPAHHVAWFADGKWLGRDPDVELHLTEWAPLLATPKRVVRQEGEQR
jgi:hypothetical protein